MAVELPH